MHSSGDQPAGAATAGPATAGAATAGPATAGAATAGPATAGPATAGARTAGAAGAAGSAEGSLAVEVAVGIERLFALLRWLTPPSSLSLTAAATLGTLLRSGPCRLTDLASREGVTQPAMTQLVARLQAGGLVQRVTDPSDGRVVLVSVTPAGRDVVAGRRAARAARLAGLVSQLTPAQQQLLAAALPVIDILASAPQDSPPPALPATKGSPS